MIGFNNVNNIKYVLSILFYEGGLSEKRNSRNTSDNEIGIIIERFPILLLK